MGRSLVGVCLLAVLAAACGDDESSSNGASGSSGTGGATSQGGSSGTGGTGGTAQGGTGGDAGDGGTGGTAEGGSGGNTGGTGGGTGGTGGGAAGSGGAAIGPDGLFLADHVFYKDVSGMPAADESDDIIGTLESLGGWGNGNTFQITFSFHVFEADASTPTAVLDEVGYPEHSDEGPFPVVPGGALEDMDDYTCDGDHDCHYLVVRQDERVLYELFAASELSPGHWRAGSFAKWYLDASYGDVQRGFGCTSADAAGLPILPGLVRVKEVVTDGEINHALRFILPNNRMRYRSLVAPASHFGGPTSHEPNAPPYGVRLRLKPSFDEGSISSAGGKVIVRALKKYGMILADGGQIALTAERDEFTAEKWEGVLTPQDLGSLEVSDFEVVDLGTVQSFDEYPDCVLQNPP